MYDVSLGLYFTDKVDLGNGSASLELHEAARHESRCTCQQKYNGDCHSSMSSKRTFQCPLHFLNKASRAKNGMNMVMSGILCVVKVISVGALH